MPFPARPAGSRALGGVRRNRPRSQKELAEGWKAKQTQGRVLCAPSGLQGQQSPRQVKRSRRCCGLGPGSVSNKDFVRSKV